MDKPFRLERVDLSIKQQITALNKRIVSLCHESTIFIYPEQF